MKTIGQDLDEFMNFIGYDMNDKKGEEDNKIVNEKQEIKEKFLKLKLKTKIKILIIIMMIKIIKMRIIKKMIMIKM